MRYDITVNLIKRWYTVTQDVEMFWIYDVFVTGVLMNYLKKKLGWTWAPMYEYPWRQCGFCKMEFSDFCDNRHWNEN